MVTDAAGWRDFVRDVLECGCPDEVLRAIARSEAEVAPGLGPVERIDVGGRLLIYLVRCSPAPAAIRNLLSTGRRERDERGFNRFRLALGAERPALLRPAAEAALAEVAPGDERAHVHVVPLAALPEP